MVCTLIRSQVGALRGGCSATDPQTFEAERASCSGLLPTITGDPKRVFKPPFRYLHTLALFHALDMLCGHPPPFSENKFPRFGPSTEGKFPPFGLHNAGPVLTYCRGSGLLHFPARCPASMDTSIGPEACTSARPLLLHLGFMTLALTHRSR